MLSATRQQLLASLNLPDVRRVSELGSQEAIVPTGHRFLDLQLPGGGWPLGSLIELLQDEPALHVWQLVLPALAEITRTQPGPVVLLGAPFEPFLPSLSAQGLAPERLLKIEVSKPQQRLWACEQALRCADVAAVLAWLPQAKSAELRRLHLAASEQQRLLYVMRPVRAQNESSAARLRLQILSGETLEVRILKRRGPPVAQPVQIAGKPTRLSNLLAARKGSGSNAPATQKDRSHVLDRPVTVE